MPQLKSLTTTISVGPQIYPTDLPALSGAGFTSIINNRPDGEEPDQPSSATLEATAQAVGLSYLHAPVRGVLDDQAVTAVADRLKMAGSGRTLMFCRSGMRSAAIWAMAQRLEGTDPDDLRRAAAAAGHDLGRLPL